MTEYQAAALAAVGLASAGAGFLLSFSYFIANKILQAQRPVIVDWYCDNGVGETVQI